MNVWNWLSRFSLTAALLLLLCSHNETEAKSGKRSKRDISEGIRHVEDLLMLRPRPRPVRAIGDLDRIEEQDAKLANKVYAEKEMSKEEKSIRQKSTQYLILPPGYNKYKLPWDSAAEPIQVEIYMRIGKILDIDEIEEHVTLDVDLTVAWTDFKILNHRRNISRSSVNRVRPVTEMTRKEINDKKRIINDPDILDTIWKPNIFFENLISIKQPYVMAEPVKLKVVPDAAYIQYITRLSVTVDCEMEFEYYPADTQICEFTIRPFSYTSTLVQLRWNRQLGGPFLRDNKLPSFEARVDDKDRKLIYDSAEDLSKKLSGLTFNIYVRRKLSYHVVQTYLASTFYIIITCLCFLLPPRMVEARIGISMTTLLTLTAMFAAVRESTPITSYVKAIDIWMVCCIFFVFLTLGQFTFYTWLRGIRDETEETQKKEQEESKIHKEKHNSLSIPNDDNMDIREVEVSVKNTPRRSLATSLKLKTLNRYESMAFFVERFSFVIFLSIFAIYSLIYWLWLLSSSNYYNWVVDPSMNYVPGHNYSDFIQRIQEL